MGISSLQGKKKTPVHPKKTGISVFLPALPPAMETKKSPGRFQDFFRLCFY
jgi:hypothetical protein